MRTQYGLIIVHYRQPKMVNELIRRAATWTQQPTSVVVVDNSQDIWIETNLTLPVSVLDPGGNVGYAAAVNIGINALRESELVLICTQDADLNSECAEYLAAHLKGDARCAVAAPMLEYVSQPGVVFSAGGRLDALGRTTHPEQGRSLRDVERGSRVVDWADGAVLMIRTADAATIGYFDEGYFLYVEEVDFQLRARLAGKQVVIVGAALARQEPGTYPTYLRYRNHTYLSRKFAHSLRPWPWRREFLRDVARMVLGRATFSLQEAFRGIADGRSGRMGSPNA
jgi:N-acetylglucosaminyl-diphospho-decaprenol L-rhamnosyltransferase